ncbi:branched-chain amino acid ABC transporter substrate-binding protein [Saxibacter everestensis]|uniref:Branched-chain amino acid ABC transporter substrate-binding protein n=1 Tax=Saxibacter everestensis TaxID=2909229 RepID=A0ABY8QZH7_9MICO|nr:branched-chain amino acid ABC transporter substrate-binding protein [Brevibacteriaceae bacterium ZFBP1038]
MPRSRKLIGAFAAAGVLALVASGCANQPSEGGGSESAAGGLKDLPALDTVEVPADAVLPAGDGKAKCDAKTTLAYVGAETGPNAQLGVNIFNGVQLAIDQHNEANPDCQVQFKKYDTEGDPNKATGPTTQAASVEDIIGIVGLPFSGESKATGNILEQKGLVHITPAATGPGLSENGWTTFFRGLGNDNVQGPAVGQLADKLGAKKVYVIEDDSEYGIGLSKTTQAALGDKVAGVDKVTTGQKDFSATISKVMNAKPDAVFFSGYYAEGAPFDSQLVGKGFEGTFIGPDGLKDNAFIEQAGDAASNAYFTCPCIPGELIKDFSAAYTKVSDGKAPGTYSIEGYDAATVLLAGIDKGKTTREDLKAWVKGYDANGLSKKYKWDEKGELAEAAVYGYKVEDGKIVSVGAL